MIKFIFQQMYIRWKYLTIIISFIILMPWLINFLISILLKKTIAYSTTFSFLATLVSLILTLCLFELVIINKKEKAKYYNDLSYRKQILSDFQVLKEYLIGNEVGNEKHVASSVARVLAYINEKEVNKFIILDVENKHILELKIVLQDIDRFFNITRLSNDAINLSKICILFEDSIKMGMNK